MTPKFTLPELMGLAFKPWIEVQNLFDEYAPLAHSNLIIQLVNDSQDHPRIKSILAAWGDQRLSLGDTGPWMTREEWLERMGKGYLKTSTSYHDAYASKIFRKYHCEGIFEVKASRFRLIVNDDTLSRLKKFENINYFLNR